MASLTAEKSTGLWRIDFKHDGKRKTFRTGTDDKRRATQFQIHLEDLIAHDKTGRPVPDSTVAWVVNLPETMRTRLEAVGLLEVDQQPKVVVTKLGEFLTAYLARRSDLKPVTMLVVGHVVRNLRDDFGNDREMGGISPAERDDFARWLGPVLGPVVSQRRPRRD